MRVLAIEDDPMSLFLLKGMLESLDCEVEAVASGEDAWCRLESTDIRIVVADWRLPGLDGLDLCRMVRERGGDYVYFILLTELEASEENENLAIDAGVDDFLSKPVLAHELRNRLRVASRILGYTSQVRKLEQFLPVCGYCKRVRNDSNYWEQVENYMGQKHGTKISHGICPDCYENSVVPKLETSRADRSPQASKGEKRPTQASIARHFGVSPATISMALRNSPRISADLRDRVATYADEIGYQPDPSIQKAMRKLRVNRTPGFKSVLYVLAMDTGDGLDLSEDVVRGCEAQAVKHGYGLEVHRVKPNESLEKLQTTLQNRGVEGLVLLPMRGRLQLLSEMDWGRFAVISAVCQRLTPDFDAVVPHWYDAVTRSYREMRALGYRRIGVVYDSLVDEVSNFRVSAAVSWCNQSVDPSQVVEPFVACGRKDVSQIEECGADLLEWYERVRPDALLFDSEELAERVLRTLKLKSPEDVGVTVLKRSPNSRFAGLLPRFFEVGTSAVELLINKIESDARGVPAASVVTKVKGQWIHGESLQRWELSAKPSGR